MNKDKRVVSTLDTLLDALKNVKRGVTVYIDNDAVIDCTNQTLELRNCINLASNGALLFSSATEPIIHDMGQNTIRGLRLDLNQIA